jgi:hypothetical protein
VDAGDRSEGDVNAVSGILPDALAISEKKSELWFADRDGVLIGRGGFTHAVGWESDTFHLVIPPLVAFQGYIVRSDAPAMLVAVEGDGAVKPLARLERRR